MKRKAPVFKFLGTKNVLKKLCVRDVLVWKVGLTLEIKGVFSYFSSMVWMRSKTVTYQPSISSWNSANDFGAKNRHYSKLAIAKVFETVKDH